MKFHNVDVLRCYRHTYQEYSHRRTTDNNEPQNITVFVSLYTSNMQERQSVKILTFWVLPSRTQLPELLPGYSINCFIKTFSTLDSFLSESSPSLLIQVDSAVFAAKHKSIIYDTRRGTWGLLWASCRGGSEAGVDLVLIQTFLLHYVNQVVLMLTTVVFFKDTCTFHNKAKEVCIKTRSSSDSHSLEG